MMDVTGRMDTLPTPLLLHLLVVIEVDLTADRTTRVTKMPALRAKYLPWQHQVLYSMHTCTQVRT